MAEWSLLGLVCNITRQTKIQRYPYLIYGNVVWGNTYKTKLIPILNIQKKILRLLTFSPYREHSKPLFDKYKILNIYQINDFLIGQFMFKYHQNNLPLSFKNFFTTNKDIHSYNTRNCMNICQNRNKTNYGVHSLKNKGGKFWNELPVKLKSLQNSLSSFKKQLKEFIIIQTKS